MSNHSAFLSLLLATVPAAQATSETKFLNPYVTPAASMGASVATDGFRAAVGAPRWSNWAGAVWLHLRTDPTWTHEAVIVAPDAMPGDEFGSSVAVSGSGFGSIAVGAPGDDGSGAAHVFQRSPRVDYRGGRFEWTWSWRHFKLLGIGAGLGDRFGASIAMAGDTVVVGAPLHQGYGAIYVFRQSSAGWVQDLIVNPDRRSGDGFGSAVAIDADRIVVGAPGADVVAPEHGALWVFRRTSTGWNREAKVFGHPASFQQGGLIRGLGTSVAISGGAIVASSPGNFYEMGFPYALVYRLGATGWAPEAALRAITTMSSWTYPSVSIHGDTIAVGCAADDYRAWNAGCVLLYRRTGTTWSALPLLTASGAAANHAFGYAVALSSGCLVVGAPGADTAGAAYGYRVP